MQPHGWTSFSAWLVRYRTRLIALAAWAVLLLAYRWYMVVNELTPLGVLRQILDLLQQPGLGPLVFVIFYTLQPLIFFPSWLLSTVAGYLYGPLWGVIFTVLASNLSSTVAFGAAWFFGRELFADNGADDLIRRYARRMRENSFATVLVMRFLYLPYDLVSYLAGFLHIAYMPFILATAIGSLPGTVAFVLFGASIEGDFSGRNIRLDPWVLGFSATLFLLSIGLWWFYTRRQLRDNPAAAPTADGPHTSEAPSTPAGSAGPLSGPVAGEEQG